MSMPEYFGEAGPSFSSFGGSGADPGGLLGTNGMQAAADSFERAVDRLTQLVPQIAQAARGVQGGIGTAGAYTANASGTIFPPMQAGTFGGPAPGAWGTDARLRNWLTSGGGTSGPSSRTSNYITSGYTGGSAVAPYNAAPANMPPTMGGTLGAPGPNPNWRFGNGPPSGGGGGGGGGGSVIGGILGGAAAAGLTLGAMASRGTNVMSGQIALNTAQYFQAAMMNGGASNANMSALAGAIYGNAGKLPGAGVNGGQMLNDLAFSPQDAAQASMIMSQFAGAPMSSIVNGQAGAYGRAAMTATNAFGYLNPALSQTGAANFMAQMYQPTTSLAMLQAGIRPGFLPRQVSTGTPRGFGTVGLGILGSFYRGRPFTNGQIFQQMGAGGMMNSNLASMGYSQAQIQAMTMPLEAVNAMHLGLNGQPSLGANQINQVFTDLNSKSPQLEQTAKNTLQRYGFNQTDLNRLKAYSGSQQQALAATSGGFTQGLAAATRALGDFRTALTKLENTFGLGTGIGMGQGFAGGLGMFGGVNFGGIARSGLELFGLARLLGLGGAGGAGGAAAAGGAGGAAAAGGLGAGLGAIAGSAGTIGGGLLVGKLLDSLLGKLPGNVGRWMGQTFKPGNILRDIFEPWKLLGSNPNARGGGAAGPSGRGATGSAPKNVNAMSTGVSRQAQEAVHAAESQLGVPYIWGGETPGVGFDCSGLTQWAYSTAGVHIPRTSEEQWAFLSKRAISLNKVQEGDLVFAAGRGDGGTANNPGHVAMMISGNKLIQAPTQGQDVSFMDYHPGDWSHAGRPSGSLVGGGGVGGTGLTSTGTSTTTTSVGHGLGVRMGTGDDLTGGGISEMSAVQGAVVGGISAGSGYYGTPTGVFATAASRIGGAGGAPGGKGSTSKGGTPGKNQAIAASLFPSYGWGQPTAGNVQWEDLIKLWTQESSWSNTAMNPTSGAYGIAQALPSSKYPLAGRPPSMGGSSNAGVQITWGLGYIKGRYGDPAGAWAHETGFNWYARGGHAPAGSYGMVGEQGPELVKFNQHSSVLDAGNTAKLMQAMNRLTYSQAHPVYSGGMGGGGATMQFASNAIVINMPVTSTVAQLTSGANARTAATQLLDQISKMAAYKAIASGANS